MDKAIIDVILSNVLEIIASILSLVVAYYVIPYLKEDFIPWLKEKRLYNIVKGFVQAAEKLAESGVIDKLDKKQYVIKLLEEKNIAVDDTVDAFIESCVKELDIVTSVIVGEVLEVENAD